MIMGSVRTALVELHRQPPKSRENAGYILAGQYPWLVGRFSHRGGARNLGSCDTNSPFSSTSRLG